MCHEPVLKQVRKTIDQQLHTLIDGCIGGDPLMQQSFYYRYYAVLMRICVRYAGNREDAEQWVHDSFLKIFASLPAYRYEGSFDGWMRRITVRICIDQLRRQQTQRLETELHTVYDDPEAAAGAHYVDNDFLQKMAAEEVLRIIGSLPGRQRAVFNLVVFEGYSHREVAALVGINENHSYLLLHQARKQLREIFQQQKKSIEA